MKRMVEQNEMNRIDNSVENALNAFFSNIIKTLGNVEHMQNDSLQKQAPEVFYKKAVLNNFSIFAVKLLCWSLFLIK